MAGRTFLNAKLAISSTLPTTFDDDGTTGYPSLTWTEFCVDAIPTLKKMFDAVSKSTTCTELDTDLKGAAKHDAPTFNFDPGDSAAAATILKTHFDGAKKNDPLAVKVVFGLRSGETTAESKYSTALVAGYADSNGGDKNTIDLKEVVMWLQREIYTIDAS